MMTSQRYVESSWTSSWKPHGSQSAMWPVKGLPPTTKPSESSEATTCIVGSKKGSDFPCPQVAACMTFAEASRSPSNSTRSPATLYQSSTSGCLSLP